MNLIANELYLSLIKKYETEIQECKTTLLIYFENPVGISDHPDHIEEMDSLVKKMGSAYDNLKMLIRTFEKQYSKL